MIDAVVDAVLTRVTALNLELPAGTVIPLVKGKQPRQEAGQSANVEMTVHPAQRPHDFRQWDTATDLHTYRVVVTMWSAGNQDNTANAAAYSAIIDTIVTTLDHKPSELAGLTGLFDVKAQTGQYVDRGSFAKGWDVQQVLVEVQIARAR